MKKYVTKKNVIIVIALVVLLLIISAVRGGNKDLTQGEVISNLSKLTLLPDVNTDTPVIAKIEVTDNIKKQFFFRDVKEGDISVLFLKNAKAYIYRPSNNSIVNSAPIVNDEVKVKEPIINQPNTSATATKTLN